MIAHLLTSFRLILVVPVSLGLAQPDLFPGLWLLIFIGLGIATDYFDGIVARLSETASPKGRLFDHSTDFLFVTGGARGSRASWRHIDCASNSYCVCLYAIRLGFVLDAP